MKNIMIINRNKLLLPIFFGLVLSLFIFSGEVASAFSCSGTLSLDQAQKAKDQGLIISHLSLSGDKAYASIQNKTDCPLPVALESFKVYDRSLSTQKYLAGATALISGNSSKNLSVNLASCMTQVDLYYGSIRNSPVGDDPYQLDWIMFQNSGRDYRDASGNFCTNTPPPPPPPPPPANITASCSAIPSSANVGDSVVWSATATGGTGTYTYSWSGTDSLSGSSHSVSKIYSSAGTKTGSVIITSGSQNVTRTCNTVITAPQDQTLIGSCSVSPSAVNVGNYLNWSASATGGDGSYTYSWTGTDSLVGNSSSMSKLYATAGTKVGTVTINSGSQNITRTCSAVVNEIINDDLTISCSASPSTVDIDEDVTWRAYPAGGNGSYSYDWTGTDSLDGNSRNLTWSYDDSGTKHATVTVSSAGQTASASCTARVNEDNNYNNDLSISCYASPSNPQIGSRMNWYASVSGGDGDYNYDWTGTDGLNSSSHSPYMTYYNAGSKRATVTVTDGDGNEESDTCYATVNQNSVLAFSQVNQTPLASAVYLSQVPYTGLADNLNLVWYILGLTLFSAWVAYIVISYKKEQGELN